jgi:APA family basic amino acid/polyamine antiporter
MALSAYFSAAIGAPSHIWILPFNNSFSILIIILLSWMHARYKRAGAGLQNYMTSFKILVLISFIIIGMVVKTDHNIDFSLQADALREIISPAFAVAIFFVSFAYSGWNASAYIAGEIKNPGRNIPVSLILGTTLVSLLYILITYVFLKMIPIGMMAGKIEIGYLFGQQVFGINAGLIMGILFSIMLLSTVSSMIITGPRVTQVMGEDYPGIRWFSHTSKHDTPQRAIYIQAIIATIYLLTATFDQMITYIGFSLNLMTLLTVLGMMINRQRHGKDGLFPYRIKPYPLLPVIFLTINCWILVYGLLFRPLESFAGLVTTALGLVFWLILNKTRNNN